MAVYRYHGAQVDTLTATANTEGEKIVLGTDSITLKVKKFSTYAIGYTESASYTVIFDSQGGSAVTAQTVAAGGKATQPANPSKSDYMFGGWYKEPSCITPWNFNNIVTESITLYAKWTNSGGGSGNSGGSGGGSAVTYAPTVIQPDHGKVTVQPRNPGRGDKVTVTLTPDRGYRANGLTVTDRSGKPVEVTDNGDGTYTFIQPVGEVTVKASFAAAGSGAYASCPKDSSCPIARFEDASPTVWYHDGVHYCIEDGLMAGYDTGLFGPGDHLTRAQLVQILYNKEGKPAVTGNSVFTDVADGQWYAPAVTWAAANGVVSGYGNGQFGPNDNITREQLAVMLWRYAGSSAAAEKELHFNDADEISGFALGGGERHHRRLRRWAVRPQGTGHPRTGGSDAPEIFSANRELNTFKENVSHFVNESQRENTDKSKERRQTYTGGRYDGRTISSGVVQTE